MYRDQSLLKRSVFPEDIAEAAYFLASELGNKAKCLVDLGPHAPNVNIEMIVARLTQFGKLGGFHFNDSKYGDDDLDTGSVDPYRLFLVFNELVEAAANPDFNPMHMLDQSHNITDPVESFMVSATEVQRAYAQALLVDRSALEGVSERERCLDGHNDAQTRVPHRRRTDPCNGEI
jgi:L-rhamnose isomerase/sugar isomerase